MGSLPYIARSWERILCAVMSVFLILLFFQSNAAGYYEKKRLNIDAYSDEELISTIDEYQTQVRVLDKQIQAIEKELDWLMVKINRISDSGRKAPRQLKTSVASKEKKANSLRKEMKELKMVKARYGKAHQEGLCSGLARADRVASK